MKTSCRLFSILAIAAVLAQSTAALAESSTPPTTQNQQLIAEVQRTAEAAVSFGVQHWLIVLVGIVGFVAFIAVRISVMNEHEEDRVRAKWHKRLHSALTLKLDTDNFSDAACWETAHDDLEAILMRRDKIQDAEAKRLLRVKDNEYEYWQIAAYAATISDLSQTEVIEILRQAEAWPYRVLKEADLQNERRASHDATTTETTRLSVSR